MQVETRGCILARRALEAVVLNVSVAIKVGPGKESCGPSEGSGFPTVVTMHSGPYKGCLIWGSPS